MTNVETGSGCLKSRGSPDSLITCLDCCAYFISRLRQARRLSDGDLSRQLSTMARMQIFLLMAASSIACYANEDVISMRVNQDVLKERPPLHSSARVSALFYDKATHTLRPRFCEKDCQAPGEGVVAFAAYKRNMFTDGWNFLYVESQEGYADTLQAYAAGYVEGDGTMEDVSNGWNNTVGGFCGDGKNLSQFCQELRSFLTTNLQWLREMISENAATDPYWHMVELFYYQLAGFSDGYHNRAPFPNMDIDVLDMYMFQVEGDLEDLQSVLVPGYKREPGSGHCSALVKLLPDNSDLFAAQDTWDGYNSMLRIIKVYNNSFHTLPGRKEVIPAQVMKFSSYPGVLMSGDDFYTLSSNMVSMETTIGNDNATRNKYIQPRGGVLEGVRNMVANRLATSGETWAKIFSRYNSGTYNNEWMIVDYKLFEPRETPLKPGVLTVLDQIPGMIRYADLTKHLDSKGYFASYNVAYFPGVFNASGGQANVEKFGDWFTHDRTPRANIFRRNHTRVTDLNSMIALMRYNNFQHDPLSRCNCTPPYSGENAISARSDLNPASGTYPFSALGHRNHGGTDMKVTSSELMRKGNLVAWSGPTYDDLPPFQWSTSGFDDPHKGQPDLFQFKPVVVLLDGQSETPCVPYNYTRP